MPDHLHVVLTPGQSGHSLSKFLNLFKGRTTSSFRESEGLKKMWQRSAFDHIIRRDENLKATVEYILNNPVREGITKEAGDYAYSKCFDDEIERFL
jgi:REP element-mobilizing transposase RayT